MDIKVCNTYHAITENFSLLKMTDGKSVFKIYYISIINRDDPTKYEWSACRISQTQYEQDFAAQGFSGIGFVTAFPHITKVFRFCPELEIILDVAVYNTPDMSQRGIERGNGYYEFACLAEAELAAEEYRAWAEAASVTEYLAFRSSSREFPVNRNDKLREYWQ